jgi:hypothetical protein
MNEESIQHAEIMKGLGKLEGLYTGIINRMDYANGRTGKLEAKSELLEKLVENQSNRIANLEKYDGTENTAKERRKNWYWGAIEKFLFIVIGFVFTVIGAVLTKVGIWKLG